jgi:hypothetical protein
MKSPSAFHSLSNQRSTFVMLTKPGTSGDIQRGASEFVKRGSKRAMGETL